MENTVELIVMVNVYKLQLGVNLRGLNTRISV